MRDILRILRAFAEAASFLRYFKPAVPLLAYLLLKLCIIIAYSYSMFVPPQWFSSIVAAGIDAESFSRYPDRMILMPLVLGRIDIPLEIILLSLAYGSTIFLVASSHRKSALSVKKALSSAGNRWIHLALASLISSAVLFVMVRIPAFLSNNETAVQSSEKLLAPFALGILVQIFLAYAGASIILERRPALAALRRSVIFAGRHFAGSLVLVTLPFLVSLPMLLLSLNPSAIASQLSPDFLVTGQIASEIVDFATGYLLVGAMTIFFADSTKSKENV